MGDRFGRIAPWCFLAICAAIFVRVSAIGWSNPLLGHAGFRQAQTAINADYLLRDGFALAYQNPVLGAPWALPFEFPTYQFSVAALVKLTGLPLEPAGRLVSLAFAVTAFGLLFVFVRRATGSLAAGATAAGLALVMPLYLFYSRAFLIESTALAFALALLVFAQRFLAQPTWLNVIGMAFAGTLAALTKSTTYATALAALAVLVLTSFSTFSPRLRVTRNRPLLLVGALAALLIPLILAFAWIAWTDAIKLRNELAAFTTSAALHDWNYGTWAQRFDPVTWKRLGEISSTLIAGLPVLWLITAIVASVWLFRLRRSSDRPSALGRFTLVCAAGFAAGPLVFTNLYFVHEYYFYAAAIYLPALGGGLLGVLWDHGRFPRIAAALLSLALAAASVHTYVRNRYHDQKTADTALPEFAAKVRELTPPDSVLLIEGSEWDSSLAFYAQRRALTNRTASATSDPLLQRALQRLDRPLGGVVFRDATKDDRYFMARQMRGLRQPFERAHASALGDIYLPLPAGSPLRREADWRQAGFAAMPLFAFSRTVELSQLAGRTGMLVHAPGVLIFAREPHHTTLHVSYGLRADAYTGGNRTDGVAFNIEFEADHGAPMQRLLSAALDPVQHAGHRGLHSASIPLPEGVSGTLTFYTETGATDAFDWSIWCDVRLE